MNETNRFLMPDQPENESVSAGSKLPDSKFTSVPVSRMAEPIAALASVGLIGPPPRPGLLGIVEHFELVRRIGNGSMGIVFQARDIETGRSVALKILRPEFVTEPRVVERFLQEARRLQVLKHAHLVPVLEVRRLEKGMFFVMPFFETGSLAQQIKSGVSLASEEILRITEQVAEALCFAHRKGIIHRDIKPDNILLGKDGSVCLADFGLARTLFNDTLIDVERDQCEGTAPYMSPAVAAGEAEDTRCDIYALGAVMYEMLAGVAPYAGPTTNAIRDQILTGPPRPIHEINSAANTRLTQVAEWAMGREHRNRYANMADFLADLRLLQSGKPPRGPHSPTGLLRSLRFYSHSPQVHALAASVVVIGIFITVGALWPQVRLESVRILQPPQVKSWVSAELAEWDGLPGKELLVADQNDLLAFSGDGSLLKQWSCPEPTRDGLNLSLISRLGKSPFDEAFLTWAQGTNLSLSVVNCNSHELKRFHATGHPRNDDNNGTTSALIALKLVPPQQASDGRAKLIAALMTGYGNRPRSLCCFDFESTKLEWDRPVGPMLFSSEIVANNGGRMEALICESKAVNNGNVGPDGTDDGHAYVFAFSEKGDRLWHTELGGAGSEAFPLIEEFGAHLGTRIIAWVHNDEAIHGSGAPEIGRVVELTRQGAISEEVHLGACLKSCIVGDLAGRGTPQIVCTDCQGDLHVLDQRLHEVFKENLVAADRSKMGRFGRIDLRIIAATKLLPGRQKQLVLTSALVTENKRENPGRTSQAPDLQLTVNPKILVLDSGFAQIAEFPFHTKTNGWTFSWQVKTGDMDGDGVDEILSLSDRCEILKLRMR